MNSYYGTVASSEFFEQMGLTLKKRGHIKEKATCKKLWERFQNACEDAIEEQDYKLQYYLGGGKQWIDPSQPPPKGEDHSFDFTIMADLIDFVPKFFTYNQKEIYPGKVRDMVTLVDRDKILARMINAELGKAFHSVIHPQSYGGVSGRSMIEGFQQLVDWASQGFTWLCRIDIEAYYDNVPVSRLLTMMLESGRISPQLARYIKRWTQVPIQKNGKLIAHKSGLHIGCPISTLLGNIYLTNLDQLCENMGYRFIRVQDDVFVLFPSAMEAWAAQQILVNFIEVYLNLKVNVRKTKVRRIFGTKILGFTLFDREAGVVISPNKGNIQRFKASISEEIEAFTRRPDAQRLRSIINTKYNGWFSYYRIVTDYRRVEDLERWCCEEVLCAIAGFNKRRSRYKALKQFLTSNSLAQKLASKNTPQKMKEFLSNNRGRVFGTYLIELEKAIREESE